MSFKLTRLISNWTLANRGMIDGYRFLGGGI